MQLSHCKPPCFVCMFPELLNSDSSSNGSSTLNLFVCRAFYKQSREADWSQKTLCSSYLVHLQWRFCSQCFSWNQTEFTLLHILCVRCFRSLQSNLHNLQTQVNNFSFSLIIIDPNRTKLGSTLPLSVCYTHVKYEGDKLNGLWDVCITYRQTDVFGISR